MIKRLVLFIVILALGISMVGAQESGAFCGDLSGDDCNILVKSGEMMGTLETVAFDFDAAMEMSGVEVSPGMGESFVMGLSGEGALNTDMDALENFQMEMNASLVIPGDLLGTGSDELGLSLVMVDGIMYMDMGSLMGMQGMAMWMGFDLTTLMADSLGMGMEDMDLGGMDLAGMEDMFSGNEFMTITRLADANMMGQDMAVFETSLDYSALFSSEGFSGMYGEIMAQALAMQGMDMDSLGMDMDAFMDMMGTMMEEMALSWQQWVGLDDYYTHKFALEFGMDMDMMAMSAAIGEAPTADMPESISFVLGGELNLSDFNAPLNIVAPEGAQIMDPAMFLGAGGF